MKIFELFEGTPVLQDVYSRPWTSIFKAAGAGHRGVAGSRLTPILLALDPRD